MEKEEFWMNTNQKFNLLWRSMIIMKIEQLENLLTEDDLLNNTNDQTFYIKDNLSGKKNSWQCWC